MSLLSDRDIGDFINQGRIGVDPYDPALLQPASLDVRLDNIFLLFDNHRYAAIDPSVEMPGLTRRHEVAEGEPLVVHPGEFVLGSTLERVELPGTVAARLEGKSSLGRLGLLVHATAGFIDPGFEGTITLEISNVASLPIKLWPGMKIGQLCFLGLSSVPDGLYGESRYASRYQGQDGPVASRSFESFYIYGGDDA